jgi:hypothetical protein
MTPEETLDNLKKTVSSRSLRSLDAIYEVCKEQLETGVNDFSFSTIAKIGEKRGVPRAQSIRNKTGESYRILINSFAKSTNNKPLKVSRKEEDWIERIEDPNTKLLVRIQAAELKDAQKLIKEFVPINTVIEVNDFSGEKSDFRLSNLERRALEYLLSPDFQEKAQLTIGDQGQFLTSDGKIMFKVATLDAIKKALEFL